MEEVRIAVAVLVTTLVLILAGMALISTKNETTHAPSGPHGPLDR